MRKTSNLHKFNIQMGCIHRNWTQNKITIITLKLKYNFNHTFKKNIANILQCQKTYFCDLSYQHSNCSLKSLSTKTKLVLKVFRRGVEWRRKQQHSSKLSFCYLSCVAMHYLNRKREEGLETQYHTNDKLKIFMK